jgi:DNA-binding response OmpR family regulator
VLVVDDDHAVVGMLVMLLGTAGYEVMTAYDGPKALQRVAEETPDVALVDLELPGLSGDEVCRRILNGAETRVVVVTGRRDPAELARYLDLGADDYITKPFDPVELLARVRAALRRVTAEAAGFASFKGVEIHARRFEVKVDGRPLDLTPVEFRLLTHLVRTGRVVPAAGLLRAVWPGGGATTVDALRGPIRQIRSKLAAVGSDLRLENIRGIGYRLT